MGNFIHSSTNGSEDQNNDTNQQYTYPPKNGNNYFSTTYLMGGQWFDTSQPEAYLFGENLDLNYLGKPTPFPYQQPQPNEPTRTLKSLINIRKESLRFVKCKIPEELQDEFSKNDEIKKSSQDPKNKDEQKDQKKEDKKKSKNKNSDSKLDQIEVVNDKQPSNYNPNANYNIEFMFDSDVKCAINIYYFCTEQIKSNSINYISKNVYINSPTYYYEPGASILFNQPNHVFNPSYYENDLAFKPLDEDGNFVANNTYPMVIHCVALEGEDPKQSHSLIATIGSDGKSYSLKPLKQKLFINGLLYLLQEIYGIEKKNIVNMSCNYSYKSDDENQPPFIPTDDDLEDNGSECIICFVEPRDTLILPCKHLCICSLCADSLRYQASSCPICRAPFRALLQIKPVRKIPQNNLGNLSNSQSFPISPIPQATNHQSQILNNSQGQPPKENLDIPPNYYALPSLVEALNGPFLKANHSMSSMKNMLIQKNNTNSINETSFNENLTPKSQRSQLSNGLNMSSFGKSSKKKKIKKQNSNASINSLKNDNLLNQSYGQENDEISLNLDDDNDSIEQIELASGQQLSTNNLSQKSTLSAFSSKETSKLLTTNRGFKQDDQVNLRRRSQSDSHSNQSRNSNLSNTSIIIVEPASHTVYSSDLTTDLDRLSIKNDNQSSKNKERYTPEIAEDDD